MACSGCRGEQTMTCITIEAIAAKAADFAQLASGDKFTTEPIVNNGKRMVPASSAAHDREQGDHPAYGGGDAI